MMTAPISAAFMRDLLRKAVFGKSYGCRIRRKTRLVGVGALTGAELVARDGMIERMADAAAHAPRGVRRTGV